MHYHSLIYADFASGNWVAASMDVVLVFVVYAMLEALVRRMKVVVQRILKKRVEMTTKQGD